MTVFIDSNIPMYVAGRAHPHKKPSTRLLRDVATGSLNAASDVEVLQEILHRYHYLHRPEDGFTVFESFLQVVPHFHPILLEDLLLSKKLMVRHPSISPRDAIHVAVMFRTGIETIVSYDKHLDDVGGIRRTEPQ
jgi:predicted nucleic acid-binding protein